MRIPSRCSNGDMRFERKLKAAILGGGRASVVKVRIVGGGMGGRENEVGIV